ncbi:hemolysin family protein [Cumulibacter soli]|uniref:hemolysin family protein n=1 Tax=Cumulibacter soli TaxID=2546344 RepID=UPI001FB9F772|nr:hemolysin family protein [Cumulibacter soli]
MWAVTMLIGLLVVLIITALTGFFVAQEFAYMAVDRSRLRSRASEGNAAATRALQVTSRTSFMLSGAQLGITVTALLVGYVAEPLIGASLGEALGGIGIPSGVSIAIGAAFALIVSTLVQMIFGELFPKNLAISRPEPVALRLATPTTAYLAAFGWLIKVFEGASNLLLRLLRIEPVHDVEHSATPRDLEHIVAESRDTGELPEELSMLLDRILDFPDQTVEHAMISRPNVGTFREDQTLEEAWEHMSTGHSRYPVLNADAEVVGVIHLQDVLATPRREAVPVRSLMRDPLLVPTTMSLPDALDQLATARRQLACVLDEYGGFVGVLTIEDLAEELVGEITDEHDPLEPEPLAHADGTWQLSGDIHLDEVERALDCELPRGDYETLAGLVISAHGSLPPVGTQIDVELPIDPADLAEDDDPEPQMLRVTVLHIRRHVPSRVRAELIERPVPTAEEDQEATA